MNGSDHPWGGRLRSSHEALGENDSHRNSSHIYVCVMYILYI